MGTAAARALSSRGRTVLLLERFTFGHANGSSGGSTRNFRLTYHDPVYVRMARHALERWRASSRRPASSSFGSWAGSTWARRPMRRRPPSRRPASPSNDPRRPRSRSGGRASLRRRARRSCTSPRERSCARGRGDRGPGCDWPAPRGRSFARGRSSTPSAAVGDGVELVTSSDEAIRAPVAIVAAGAWTAPLLRDGRHRPAAAADARAVDLLRADRDGSPIPTIIDWDRAPSQPPYLVPNPSGPGRSRPARTCPDR